MIKATGGTCTVHTRTDEAWVHLTRLCGCNYRTAVTRQGKSVFVTHPNRPDKQYRINAAKFDAGEPQFRDSWCIEQWSDRADKTSDSEAYWQD